MPLDTPQSWKYPIIRKKGYQVKDSIITIFFNAILAILKSVMDKRIFLLMWLILGTKILQTVNQVGETRSFASSVASKGTWTFNVPKDNLHIGVKEEKEELPQ